MQEITISKLQDFENLLINLEAAYEVARHITDSNDMKTIYEVRFRTYRDILADFQSTFKKELQEQL